MCVGVVGWLVCVVVRAVRSWRRVLLSRLAVRGSVGAAGCRRRPIRWARRGPNCCRGLFGFY